MKEYPYYVNGQFLTNEYSMEVVDPATGKTFSRIFEAQEKDLQQAISAARSAQREWRSLSFPERAKELREIGGCMVDNVKALADLETREIGKPIKESLFVDISLGADCFQYYASYIETLPEKIFSTREGKDYLRYDPFGIVGVYLPYNVPLMIWGFSCAAILAAGNALIVKPSEHGSLSLLALMQYVDKLDLPRGLINVITGKGDSIGNSLAKSRIDMLSFTGSRKTLKKIIAASAENPKKIICELGGCNITTVFSDADQEAALQNILAASFMKQGQICVGNSVLLVHNSIYEEFISRLVQKTSQIKVGDPCLPDTGVGPLPTKDHRDNLNRRIEGVLSQDAKILSGGGIIERDGYFYPPTIIEVDKIVYEEFFAPVLLVKRFSELQEAEGIISDNPTGLVLQLWTNNLSLAHILAEKYSYGTVWINTFVQMNSQTPFGGMKKSGWGRNLGKCGFFEYIQTKHIGIGFTPSPVCGWFGV